MKTKDTIRMVGRRGFMGALTGLSAGAAIVASGASPANADEAPDERLKARYQESPHVLKFYETNRYVPKKN